MENNMKILEEVIQEVKQYREDYKEAGPGYKNWSQTLRKKIPGKTQVKSMFIDSLQELRCLAVGLEQEDAKNKIDKLLKGFE